MRTSPPDALPIFRSDLQARLLAALFLNDGAPLTTRELAERTAAKPATLHRELGRVEDAGLITHESVGRTKRYRAATESPLHRPLRELLERTLGVEPLLRRGLAEVEGVERAAIFGSWAEGRSDAGSDIDLLVIGDIDRDALLAAVREVERQVHREIDVTAYRPDEFERRRGDGSGFLRTVLRGPLIQLVGEVL
ncbi:MAG TPA: nucleotidyltransferase domain-containing protein [Thermoleophilaceae bacterium]|nr:nucleotidyltransferase domain-containing protein [Thermoleophilaceae bacterium]